MSKIIYHCAILLLLVALVNPQSVLAKNNSSASENNLSQKEKRILAEIEKHKKTWCKVKWDPEIDIVPITSKVKYKHDKSTEDLSSMVTDTDSPYADDAITHTRGMMAGKIQVKSNITLESIDYDGLFCVYYDKIRVEISIDPTVYLSSELKKGSCLYKEVKKHENKHVMVDRRVVNKYAQKVGKKLVEAVNEEMLVGPLREKHLTLARDHLQNRIKAKIDYISRQMYDERNRRQQIIDSLGEYQDVSDNCR